MNEQKKTVAVTGGTGFIGSHVLSLLASRGYDVRLLSRRAADPRDGVSLVEGDVRSREAVIELMRGCQSVVHLAGIAHSAVRLPAEIRKVQEVNVGGTQNVLAAAKAAGVGRVLLASSALVYRNQEGMDLDEGSATAPDTVYARSKLEAERAGLKAAEDGRMSVCIARPCLTYGPGVRTNLESLMGAVRRHYYFHIRDKNPMRSFLSVGNAAAAMLHLLRSGESGRIYNLADRTPRLLAEFVDAIADQMSTSRPRTLPLIALQAAIVAAGPLQWMGIAQTLNSDSLRKLTTSFTLNVGVLSESGFCWLNDEMSTRKEMVDSYLESRRSSSFTRAN